ncbi:MAG: hypothetical protein ACREKE_05165 [bacterium]
MSKKNRDETEAPRALTQGATRWSDYFWVCLIFFSFVAVLAYATWLSCQAPGDDQIQAVGVVLSQTLWFFVLLMGGGFLLVLLFDAAYEFFAGKAGQEPPPQEPPKA